MDHRLSRLRLIARAVAVVATGIASGTAIASPCCTDLSAQWRSAAEVTQVDDVPDFSRDAMVKRRERLTQARVALTRASRGTLTTSEWIDTQLIAAEMNGLDFQLRTLRPWARDPGFYQTIWAEQSDVPAHEGPYAPGTDLFTYDYPLDAKSADRLAAALRTVVPLLEQARRNLAGSQAHDLFAYGAHAFREQADTLAKLEAGTLAMRTLDGEKHADLSGAGARLIPMARAARSATLAFASWIETEAPKRKGVSGIGKAEYDWQARNVHLLPYGWDEQVTLLKRELERAHAALRLEELHNRALPPLVPANDPVTFERLSVERARRVTQFLIDKGFVPDTPYYRAAIPAQTAHWTPPTERDFFAQVVARDPLPLYTHFYHWIELARLKHAPLADPIRQEPLLFNIWQERSEGFATAMEEIALHAGLYDDLPRGRELVWIMLANRAARGLASLYVQANMMTLEDAGRFHARWTPRGWSVASSQLVGFEQLLYLRQPGYGASYVVGKLQFDRLLADLAEQAEKEGRPFDAAHTLQAMWAPGIIPLSLIEDEMKGAHR